MEREITLSSFFWLLFSSQTSITEVKSESYMEERHYLLNTREYHPLV